MKISNLINNTNCREVIYHFYNTTNRRRFTIHSISNYKNNNYKKLDLKLKAILDITISMRHSLNNELIDIFKIRLQ